MVGIYSFINLKNNKRYVGQSRNLENRYKSHLRNYTNKNLSTYNGLFYRALRKYGVENFIYEINIVCNDNILQEELNDLEMFYIDKFNSYENGYNMNIGGRFTSGVKTLKSQDVKAIQKKIFENKISFTEIANQYQVSVSTISNINFGYTWNENCQYEYPIRQFNFNNIGGSNPNAKLDDDFVISIRREFVNSTLEELYNKYKEKCSYSTFKKAIYGVSFLHLPVYKKKEKRWFLDGTCIDYPRIEE